MLALRRFVRIAQIAPRRYSTAADTLPLEGIRVLDMTRVLAGVSRYLSNAIELVNNCSKAVLYTNPW